MPFLLSEDFVRNKLGKLMAGRDERLFRDSKLTGHALRARRLADGGTFAKDWFVLQRVPGKSNPRKILVGDHPTFSADAARAQATTMLQAMMRGDDPAAERAAKKAAPVWEDLVVAFMRKHAPKRGIHTILGYEGAMRRILNPALKGKRVADITTAMVAAMHARHADTPVDADRAISVLSKIMNFGVGEGWRDSNPVRGITRYGGKRRERWLDETELPKFLAALADETDSCADLIRFLVVSGWRVSDGRLLRWDQVNLKNLTVNLANSTTKKRASVLSADAAALIDHQPGRVGAVFSRRAGRPVEYEHLLERLAAVCARAGIARITPHTLRHSAATWAAIHGADMVELRDAFGWRSFAMPARYVHRADTVARRGVERVAAAINIHGRPNAEVVPLAGGKAKNDAPRAPGTDGLASGLFLSPKGGRSVSDPSRPAPSGRRVRPCTDAELVWALETYLPAEILPDARARVAQLMSIAWQATAATRAAQPGHPEGGIGSLVEIVITHTGTHARGAHEKVAALHRQWRMRNRTVRSSPNP